MLLVYKSMGGCLSVLSNLYYCFTDGWMDGYPFSLSYTLSLSINTTCLKITNIKYILIYIYM